MLNSFQHIKTERINNMARQMRKVKGERWKGRSEKLKVKKGESK